MASNINRVLLVISIGSLLLALFPQAQSTFDFDAPAASPGPASDLPVDAKTQVTQFIESTMILGRHKTEEYLQEIEKQVKDPATPGSTLQCLKVCKEVYEDAIDEMKNTIDDLESGNYYKANVDITAVSANADACSDCYKEMAEEDAHAKNFDNWFMWITNDCLDKLETFTS